MLFLVKSKIRGCCHWSFQLNELFSQSFNKIGTTNSILEVEIFGFRNSLKLSKVVLDLSQDFLFP